MGEEIKNLNDLRGRIAGPVFTSEDEGYAAEISCFNLAIAHSPDLVVGAESEADVAEAVKFAAEEGLRVSVQATGHTDSTITSGLLISMKRLNGVTIDAESKTATAGGGTKWQGVITPAAEHGLTAVAGSSPTVGVTGYLLGGGFGPIVRSHGFSSDYLVELRIVTGTGEVLVASADENTDLFWAARGGKYGFGIVTQLTIRLVELPELYAGSLFFAEDDIETACKGWFEWTASADARVSTSAAIVQFPPFDAVPSPLRGRQLLNIRFAFPGPADEGTRLAEPIRSLAPVYMDAIGELPASEMARIHNDPAEPGPSWVRGALFSKAGPDFAAKFLEHAGAGAGSPFVSVEIRHLGGAAATDVEAGSAAGGRDASYVLAVVAVDTSQFQDGIPNAYSALVDDLDPWLAPVSNINFVVVPADQEHLRSAWSPETWQRLEGIRRENDPQRVFASYPV